MTRSMWSAALLLAVAVAPVAGAQQPASPAQPAPGGRMAPARPARDGAPRARRMAPMGPAGMGHMMPAGGAASMLLAHTAELKLNDGQVTRLAALARAAEAQHVALKASMDSMHRAMMATHTAGAAMPPMTPEMQAHMKRMRDMEHDNVRDALAVLTPDQLATAWEQHHSMMGMGGPAGGAMMAHPMGSMDDHMDSMHAMHHPAPVAKP